MRKSSKSKSGLTKGQKWWRSLSPKQQKEYRLRKLGEQAEMVTVANALKFQ